MQTVARYLIDNLPLYSMFLKNAQWLRPTSFADIEPVDVLDYAFRYICYLYNLSITPFIIAQSEMDGGETDRTQTHLIELVQC